MMFDIPILGDVSAASRKVHLEDNWDGSRDFLWFDHDGNPVGLQRVADHAPVIEANKAAQNSGTRGFGESREWQKVASIPIGVLYDYCAIHGIPLDYALGGKGQDEVIQRILKDYDYKYFRTT